MMSEGGARARLRRLRRAEAVRQQQHKREGPIHGRNMLDDEDDDLDFAPTRTAAARAPPPVPTASSAAASSSSATAPPLPSSCKQDPALVCRVIELASNGSSLSDIDFALHSGGFHNSAGKLWPKSSDGCVIKRILTAAGLPVPPKSHPQPQRPLSAPPPKKKPASSTAVPNSDEAPQPGMSPPPRPKPSKRSKPPRDALGPLPAANLGVAPGESLLSIVSAGGRKRTAPCAAEPGKKAGATAAAAIDDDADAFDNYRPAESSSSFPPPCSEEELAASPGALPQRRQKQPQEPGSQSELQQPKVVPSDPMSPLAAHQPALAAVAAPPPVLRDDEDDAFAVPPPAPALVNDAEMLPEQELAVQAADGGADCPPEMEEAGALPVVLPPAPSAARSHATDSPLPELPAGWSSQQPEWQGRRGDADASESCDGGEPDDDEEEEHPSQQDSPISAAAAAARRAAAAVPAAARAASVVISGASAEAMGSDAARAISDYSAPVAAAACTHPPPPRPPESSAAASHPGTACTVASNTTAAARVAGSAFVLGAVANDGSVEDDDDDDDAEGDADFVMPVAPLLPPAGRAAHQTTNHGQGSVPSSVPSVGGGNHVRGRGRGSGGGDDGARGATRRGGTTAGQGHRARPRREQQARDQPPREPPARTDQGSGSTGQATREPAQSGERCAFCGEAWQRWGAHTIVSAP